MQTYKYTYQCPAQKLFHDTSKAACQCEISIVSDAQVIKAITNQSIIATVGKTLAMYLILMKFFNRILNLVSISRILT